MVNRLGLFGGFDVDVLCQNSYDDVFRIVMEQGKRFRDSANGYGLGSGNSIAEYVPIEGFQAMVDATIQIRKHR